jgi:methionyl-tRNA synthetase
MDTKKMSKSIGNTLNPYKLSEFWGMEGVNYFLLREVTLVSDSDYSVEVMLSRHNSDFGDVFGNLVSEMISPSVRRFTSLFPRVWASIGVDRPIEDAELLIGLLPENFWSSFRCVARQIRYSDSALLEDLT